jgi:vacuolar-type H+-ATPase subunit F/Vma7
VGLVVVLGETARVEGFALGGATVIAAEDRDAVLRAWATLGDGVAVVVLTTNASAALDGAPAPHDGILTVVMPP